MQTELTGEYATVAYKDAEHVYISRVYRQPGLFPWVTCSLARNECRHMWVAVNDDFITDWKSKLKRME